MNSSAIVADYLRSFIHEDFKQSQTSLAYSQNLNIKKLYKRKPKKVKQTINPATKKLTSAEKKVLHYLPRKYMTFDEGLALHKEWLQYFKDVVDVKKLCVESATPNEFLHCSIVKMCFSGARIKIVQSINKSLIGIEGVVVMDFMNTFRIVDKKNLIKIIPKKGSLFEFQADDTSFSIYGDHLCIRPIERMTKKAKSLKLLDFPKIHGNNY